MTTVPGQAHAGSIEAVDAFRARLVVFLSRARVVLEEVGGDLQRLRLWLEGDRRPFWQQELRRRARHLEEAQAALFSARLATFQEATAAQQAEVHVARRRVTEAEDKLRVIDCWLREFEARTEALRRQVHAAESCLSHDMAQAVAFLTEALRLLQAYAEVAAPVRGREGGTPEGRS